MRYIRDPIFGDIALREDEFDLLSTVEMQRLSRLRQLHLVYLVYPGATHSRLSHSLGTLQTLTRILHDSDLGVTIEERRHLRLAALLHDVGHAAFAHVLEPSLKGSIPRHEEVTQSILNGESKERWYAHSRFPKAELERATFVADEIDGDTAQAVGSLLSGENVPLSSLISGIIDADNLDYIRRDSHYLGLTGASFDDAVFSGFRFEDTPDGPRTVFRRNPIVLSAVCDVIYSRWHLFRHAYLHHAVMAANAMLVQSVRAGFRPDKLAALYVMTDDEVLRALASADSSVCLGDTGEAGAENGTRAQTLAARILERRLYKRAYAVPTYRVESEYDRLRTDPSYLGQLLATLTGEGGDDVMIGFPITPPEKQYKKLNVEGGEKIEAALATLGLEESLEMYSEKYRYLKVLYVYASTEEGAKNARLAAACARAFNNEGILEKPEDDFRGRKTGAEFTELVERLDRKRPAARRILRVLAENEELETSAICAQAKLSSGTVSTYLGDIRDVCKEMRLSVLRRRPREGNRGASWSIPSLEHRKAILAALEASDNGE